MSTAATPTLATPTLVPTTELHKLVAAISKLQPWEEIYHEHWLRTGGAEILVAEHHVMRGYGSSSRPKYYAVATSTVEMKGWNSDLCNLHDNVADAREDLFHKMVAAALELELNTELAKEV